jgi:short-subunit dehydrogenase
VTGASAGLGRHIAKKLAPGGGTIAVLSRRLAPLEDLVREIEDIGGSAHPIVCDVTDQSQVIRAISRLEAEIGPIERLVLCVGGGRRTAVDDFRAIDTEEMMKLNVFGAANCLEAVLPGMLHRGRGHIVAVSSLAAARGLPGAPEYSAAKAALSTLLEGLRIDLKSRGIDVTILSPGFVRREQSKKRRPMDIPADVAAERMVRAIERRKRTYAFPLWPVLFLAILRCLPAALADAVVGMIRSRSKVGRQSPRAAQNKREP